LAIKLQPYGVDRTLFDSMEKVSNIEDDEENEVMPIEPVDDVILKRTRDTRNMN